MALSSKSVLQRYGKERRFDESDNSLLSRLLTVRYNDANLTKIGDLSGLTNLVKLYVRNNQITNISNISTAPQLTYLYVINNKLTELESITKLTKLEKLYAGGNNIQIIEGLSNLDNLLELHLENQRLQPGEKMHLEPESLNALSWLQVLNISNNGVDNLDFIENLKELRILKCEDNKIERFDDLSRLRGCIRLQDVTLRGNPISKIAKYRDQVILNVKEITKLDDKMIKSNEKEFIRNWHQHKVNLTRENTRVKSQPIRDEETVTYDQADISHLASGLPSGIDNLVRLIKEREDKRITQSPSAPEFIKQSIPSQPILHQTLSYGDTAFEGSLVVEPKSTRAEGDRDHVDIPTLLAINTEAANGEQAAGNNKQDK